MRSGDLPFKCIKNVLMNMKVEDSDAEEDVVIDAEEDVYVSEGEELSEDSPVEDLSKCYSPDTMEILDRPILLDQPFVRGQQEFRSPEEVIEYFETVENIDEENAFPKISREFALALADLDNYEFQKLDCRNWIMGNFLLEGYTKCYGLAKEVYKDILKGLDILIRETGEMETAYTVTDIVVLQAFVKEIFKKMQNDIRKKHPCIQFSPIR